MSFENLNLLLKIGDVVILKSGGPDMTVMFIKAESKGYEQRVRFLYELC